MIGQTVSHYRITEKLGEGGMGVVYKADDTQLRIPVALKFLPRTGLSDEAENRLIREAQTAAALDHPNICRVYGIHREGEQTFIAMAFVDGPSLDKKIEERRLPLEEALDIAIQAGEGLQEAHQARIIHRDIKPQNIMLTSRGQVKIMDFGLAQLSGRSRLTQPGTVLGTPSYMAPEQLQGDETDRRADIWALGVVLYEMLAQRLPFAADYREAEVYAILNEEPEALTAQRSDLPLEIDQVISKALAKEPAERYQNIEDLLVDLRRLKKQSGIAPAPLPSPPRPIILWKQVAMYTGLLLVGVLAGFTLRVFSPGTRSASPSLPELRFSFEVSELSSAEISPDGRHIAYVAEGHLWIRPLQEEQARRIEGTPGTTAFAWSPDSKSIAFRLPKGIKRVEIQGTSPTTLWEGEEPRGIELLSIGWNRDGRSILFLQHGAWQEIPAAGGLPRPLPARGSTPQYWPSRSLTAGSRAYVYFKGFFRDQHELVMGDPAREVPRVIGKGAFPWYAPSGHIVYESIARPEGIWAMPLSSETLNVGEPFPVAANGLRPSVSNDGTLVYWEDRDEKPRLVEFDRGGNLVRTIGQPQVGLARPDLSPDGRRVAVWGEGRFTGRSIYLHEVDRPASRPLLIDQHNEIQPLWGPGNRLAFSSNREGGRRNLYAKMVDRNDPPELLLSGPENYYASDWSADGLHILVTKAPGTEGSTDLWYLKLNESGQHSFKPFRTTQHSETDAAFSPDGRYVAFVSNDTGRLEVYVCSFPDCDGLQQVSVGGGMRVRWAKEGGSLYYAGANDALVEVTIRTQPTLSVGEVQPLFTFAGIFNPQMLSKIYDVSDDGQRFVFSSPGAKKPGIIHVWQNWAAGFRSSESNQ